MAAFDSRYDRNRAKFDGSHRYVAVFCANIVRFDSQNPIAMKLSTLDSNSVVEFMRI